MNEPGYEHDEPKGANIEERQTMLFLSTVAQHANMALMFLGRIPHPETGERVRDLESARMLIGQLEMLEAKTQGNLSKREQSVLKQSLMSARMAFVEAVEEPPPAPSATPETPRAQAPVEPSEAKSPAPAAAPASAASGEPAQPELGAASTAAAEAEARKKFVKRY